MQTAYRSIKSRHNEKVDVPKERQFVGFDAYKQVLECDCDLVIMATPPGFRPMHFAHAIEKGKHVFMEKPVAVDGPVVAVRRFNISNVNPAALHYDPQSRSFVGYKSTSSKLPWRGARIFTATRLPGRRT